MVKRNSKKRFIALFMISQFIVLPCNILVSGEEIGAKKTKQAIKVQLEESVHQRDWQMRESAVMELRKLGLSEFDTDEKMLDLTWDILKKEVDFIHTHGEILYENREYQQYFETLVRLISLHQKRFEKYELHSVLVTLPYWYEKTFRVIANEGGEDILPQLLEKLSNNTASKQDLREGIIMITYTNIARGKYSKKSIQTLKEIYLKLLSGEAFNANDSSFVKDRIREKAIIGLGVIGDRDVLPKLKLFLYESSYEKDATYNSDIRVTKNEHEIKAEKSLREEAERVLDILNRGEKLMLDDIMPVED